MTLAAIDPGPTLSGLAVVDERGVLDYGFTYENGELNSLIQKFDEIVIEKIEPYGQPVGREVFDTVLWTGRFVEQAIERKLPVYLMPRKQVAKQLQAKNDSEVRVNLVRRFGGTLSDQLQGHTWQAYALGVAFTDLHQVYRDQYRVCKWDGEQELRSARSGSNSSFAQTKPQSNDVLAVGVRNPPKKYRRSGRL